ncbi:hypothetical protein ACFQXA_22205 [Nocardiopsis composta]
MHRAGGAGLGVPAALLRAPEGEHGRTDGAPDADRAGTSAH